MAAQETERSVDFAVDTEKLVTADASLSSVSSHNTTSDIAAEPTNVPEKSSSSSEPLRVYSRGQLLRLSKSPLVKPPPYMPELKDWFGENELGFSKKDSEPASGNARERRFRRDTDDGENPSRSNFRPTLSQPSQMGNFKLHSVRVSDRDRDKENEKERERDIRDREGQERLRHLSDKFDRDRLGLPSAGLRNKERDTAVHLLPAHSNRLSGQGQGSGSRREPREGSRRKPGEASEDWRRGADSRPAKDDRPECIRRERDDRSRQKSGARDSSRTRREPSTSRRERDREAEKDNDEDSRRWRDDGKRDERLAARRGERNSEPYRDRDRARGKEAAWDASGDRRWVTAEDRDGRSKRSTARDKKLPTTIEDGRERDDRKDKEREKEKEPAWMETYIPNSTGAGILGGKTNEGELDGIQAWKKELKEKERKSRDSQPATKTESIELQDDSSQKQALDGQQLDEIQLFRLLMKREEEKKKADAPAIASHNSVSTDSHPCTPSTDPLIPPSVQGANSTLLPQTELPSSSPVPPPTLLSILSSKEGATFPLNTTAHFEPPNHLAKSTYSAGSTNSTLGTQSIDRDGPPQGSRLLAFARAPNAASRLHSDSVQNGVLQKSVQPEINQKVSVQPEAAPTVISGFAPFEEHPRMSSRFDGQKNPSDSHRRALSERPPITPTLEHAAFTEAPPNVDAVGGFSASKGSRFAKFFDGRAKDSSVPSVKSHVSGTVLSSSPSPGIPRPDLGGFNGIVKGTPDPRTLDEIYHMLSKAPTAAPLLSNGSMHLAGRNELHMLQQQLQQQQLQQQVLNNRLEPLYESRLQDRNFVPDGMVPGLRSTMPRDLENNLYSEAFDDGMQFNPQRNANQRGFEQVYSDRFHSVHPQQATRNNNVSLQQLQYRRGPSPISHQHNLLSNSQQRLPPGLANLGGRPPHDPSSYIGLGMSHGLHGSLPLDGSQHSNNSFASGAPGFGGPQLRGPQQLQNAVSYGPMGHVDLRATSQSQYLGGMSNLRAASGNFLAQQQGAGGHLSNSLLGIRPQQQPSAHMMGLSHMQQQQHVTTGPNNSPNQDLMALLMGGSHREQ